VGVNFRLLVFLTALATLMFELVAARLADFHLGAGNAYLAIPITFLGLALGSLHVHARRKIVDRFRPVVALTVLAGLCFAAILLVFVVFAKFLPVVSALQEGDNYVYLLVKTLAFIGILLPPFYYFGRILTVAYQIKREDIGAIYSADFWGAALACAITPVLFHFGGLPNVSLVLLGLTFLPILIFFRGKPVHRLLIGLLLLVTCVIGERVITTMDDSLDYGRYYTGISKTEELTRRWNEHSRVAVLHQTSRASQYYKIVHDNSRSNVHVRAYRPERVGRAPHRLEAAEVAAILQRPIRNVLVVFAGCGREMIALNEFLGGEAHITGVELNPLVREMAVSTEELEPFRLQEFFDLPNIDLVIDEGRHFLSTTSQEYDLIFVGSNAATAVWLTGHSRKYLDTVEAFHLYLDHLADGGLIVFDHQPVRRRIESMKVAFQERNIPQFPKSIVVLDSYWSSDDMLISPSGFSRQEIERLFSMAKNEPERVRYAPHRPPKANHRHYKRTIESAASVEKAMTDDRPFLLGLDWKGYRLRPETKSLGHHLGYLSWIKITTLLIMIVIASVFIVAAAARKSADLPPSILFYLLLTGFCFMLVEIALIAKLELFLQKPIVSMATVLSTFLLTSGIGSRLFPRIKARIRISVLAVIVAGLAVASIYLVDGLSAVLLGIPIPAKLLVAVIVMAPIGISLGLFYPYAVTCLVSNDRPQTVAITYGISTLSSVIGATYAMTVMIDMGFSSLLWQASVGYVALAVLYEMYATVLKGRFLTL
jgi:spermidine synthase